MSTSTLTDPLAADPGRHHVTLGDGQHLVVIVTDEGVIIDLVVDDEVVASRGQTFDEIAGDLLPVGAEL